MTPTVDKDIKLTSNEIYALQSATLIDSSDRQAVEDATIDDLDSELCNATFDQARVSTPRSMRGAETTEERLKRLNFTNSQGEVTKAGLLAAGVYPQQFFPKLVIDVAVHPGVVKASGGRKRFEDRAICEGTIGEMIEDAIRAVNKNLRRASTIDGTGRNDEFEIPGIVLREAITNALIHRSYNKRFDGEDVAIDIFDDRIEITNPGGLWGKSKDELADGRSCCRNATLMKLMSLVPLPSGEGSPAEGNGGGIPLMINEMNRRGLKPPEFRPSIDHFKIVFDRPSASQIKSEHVLKGEAFIKALLEKQGEMSLRELAEQSNLTLNQARRRVNALIDKGVVKPTAPATSRNRKYRINE